MRFANVFFVGAFVGTLGLAACGGSSGSGISIPDLAGTTGNTDPDLAQAGSGDMATGNTGGQDIGIIQGDGGTTIPPIVVAGANAVPLTVDSGPTGQSANIPTITIKLCAPGSTTMCQTIDHVLVDTGSVGLRVLNTAFTDPTVLVAMTPVHATTSNSKIVGECYNYVQTFVWGSVRKADLTIGGETASAMPFQVIGDPSVGPYPKDCPASPNSMETDDLAHFGSNAIIGVGNYAPDCDFCTTAPPATPPNQTTPNDTGWYYWSYSAAAGATAIGLAQASQLSNPVSLFKTDNNGVIIDLPDPGNGSIGSMQGALIFGIGTQTNNQLPSTATIFPVGALGTPQELMIPGSTVDGVATQEQFFDSGTNFVTIEDKKLADCTSQDTQGFFCPTGGTATIPCSNSDGTTDHAFNFDVGNTDDIFNAAQPTDAVFKAVVVDAGQAIADWGLPFFYGRPIYVSIEGTTVTGTTAKTPFSAY